MSPVTQKTIAEVLGLDVSTVSKALNGDPRIAAATRAAVGVEAQRLGYRRDPMLSALANHRRGLRVPGYKATIAWVCNHGPEVDMGVFAGYHEYLAGAQARARQLGYAVERFYVDGRRLNARRLGEILLARNIRSVVVAPQAQNPQPLDLPWDQLCAITIGYTFKEPTLNLVTNDHFFTMTEIMRIVQARGYRKVGCYMSRAENERMGRRAGSAFMAFSKESNVTVALFDTFNDVEFMGWVREQSLDAVIGPGRSALRVLRENGIQPPTDMGLVGYALSADEKVISGMSHSNFRIGELLVDQLCRAFEHGERGIPAQAVRLLVPSVWLENETL
ncbi:MAG: LacI family transcriptional regulator [Verrucomicrobia bacterium]|nr:LacI family transcriptional regulator [Verrucomicrobiota bacterium]